MSAYTGEIQQLQLRILELEKQKQYESDKKTSIDLNFKIINDLLTERKYALTRNYCKSVPLARYYDEELVTRLEAIYNILQIVDQRLKKLEET